MTSAQYHAIQVKAMRNGRRYLRTMRTSAEGLERIVDRLISSKKEIKPESYALLSSAWSKYKTTVAETERALADSISSGSF